MNKLITLTALICLALQCETKQASPEPESGVLTCGVKDPAKELAWLRDIITKAEADRTTKTHSGNYIGTIYLEKFNDKDVFHTDMAMGSGGLTMRVYYCDGQSVSFTDNDQMLAFVRSLKKTNLIYTNTP
ncbi:hypothetical protein A6C57_04625 [Fibrella sp. ES10-3-2-2]|nr:hypothetical protein A6C57_04625 [Fibrella sp. ES10-3-2-2]